MREKDPLEAWLFLDHARKYDKMSAEFYQRMRAALDRLSALLDAPTSQKVNLAESGINDWGVNVLAPADLSRACELYRRVVAKGGSGSTFVQAGLLEQIAFRVLYCFFVIEHGRRKILHFNVTEHPTGPWIVQQLREAFPDSCPYRYAILDRDGKFGEEVTDILTASGMKPTPISPASPWQNGVAERWIGSCRRELLDHVIALSEAHVRRLIRDYIFYYHADRTHDSLKKDTPAMRPVSSKPKQSARLVSFPRIGGLHHRYDWQQAA